MEEVRGETFTWNELKENFLNDFKFLSQDELLVKESKEIKTFLQPTNNTIEIENRRSQQNATCHNIQLTKIQHSTRFRLETETTRGKNFQWKVDHPETSKPIKTIFKIQTSEK